MVGSERDAQQGAPKRVRLCKLEPADSGEGEFEEEEEQSGGEGGGQGGECGGEELELEEDDEDGGDHVAFRWQFDMMNDEPRNRSYDLALRAALKKQPGAHVLDIGTGNGLLSMMALRAGAGRVTACDVTGALVDAAKEGLAEAVEAGRASVLHKHSSDLVVGEGEDMKGPADVLVAEIFDSELFGEEVLGTYSDAIARLLRPGAALVPRSARLFGALVECDKVRRENTVGTVEGFDLSGLQRHRPDAYDFFRLPCVPHERLSAPAALASFDFGTPSEAEGSEYSATIPVTRSGRFDALAFWYTLQMGFEGVPDITTSPDAPEGAVREHWSQAFYVPPEALRLEAGSELRVRVLLQGDRLYFSACPAPADPPAPGPSASAPRVGRALPRACLAALNDGPHASALAAAARAAAEARTPLRALAVGCGPAGLVALAAAAACAPGGDSSVTLSAPDAHWRAVFQSDALIPNSRALRCPVRTIACAPADLDGYGSDEGGKDCSPLREGAPYNAVLSELLDMELLAHGGSLSSVEHALLFAAQLRALRGAGLLDEDCAVVPAGARVMAAPIASEALALRFATVDARRTTGFEMEAMRHLREVRAPMEIPMLAEGEYALLSEPAQVLELDFAAIARADADPGPRPGDLDLAFRPVRDGKACAVLIWLEIRTAPGAPPISTHDSSGCYRHTVQFLGEPAPLERGGAPLALTAVYSGASLRFRQPGH
eukprot:tig00020562_g11154.t1